MCLDRPRMLYDLQSMSRLLGLYNTQSTRAKPEREIAINQSIKQSKKSILKTVKTNQDPSNRN